jgi:hypothetical protein
LEELVLVMMDRPTQFRVTQSILLFESSGRKDFFPAKEFISLHLTRL